jgi:hypothetical protein
MPAPSSEGNHPKPQVLEGLLLDLESPGEVTIATESPHKGLGYLRWQKALPTPSDNGDEPHGSVRHNRARIVRSQVSIMVHPPADHFPCDEQEYVKVDLY